jgi:LPS-assembly protein
MKKLLRFVPYALCLAPCSAHAAFDIAGDTSAKTIVADKIEYNVKGKSISTRGKTDITSAGGQRLTLADSYLSPDGEAAAGKEVEMTLGAHMRITAKSIERKNGETDALDATYTNCYKCDDFADAWAISASRIHHDVKTHIAKFYNPVFRLYGVPVFWAPWLEYPDPEIRHKSGFLLPEMNTTNDMGTQITLPLYIAFSDTHDLTVSGSYLTRENPLWQLEHRLNLQRSSFKTNGSYTMNQEGAHRWHVFNNDLIEMGGHARTEIFLARTSDQIYLQKYGFYNDQPYLDSGFRTELFTDSGYATIESHVFQELRTYHQNRTNPSGNILPQVHGVYQTSPMFAETYATFTGDVLGVQNNISGSGSQRMLGVAKITSPWILPLGQKITASASARYDIYNFINTDMLDGQTGFSGLKSRFLPSGYAEWSSPFMRAGRGGWTQIIEPKARITVMNHKADDTFALNNDSAGALLSNAVLFSENRFSGYDVWENGTYADYGASWSAFSDQGDNAEIFLGQSYDFDTRPTIDPNSGFHNGASDFVGRAEFSKNNWLFFANRFRLDKDSMSLRHLESAARIGSRNYISLGYIWTQQLLDAETISGTANEITGALGIYFTERFGLRAGTTYNITDDRIQKQNIGLVYDHPCYSLLLEYIKDGARRYDDEGNEYVGNARFRFQFALRFNGGK